MKAVTYTIKYIGDIGSTIETILKTIQKEHLLSDAILFETKVVLNELIVNALCHGNNCEIHKETNVIIKVINNYLYICVKDQGYGFNPHKYSLKEYIDKTNKDFCEHGRGLLIVEQLCNKIKYNSCGNKVTVIKYLH